MSCFEARVVGVLVSHRTAVRCYQEGAASGSGVVVRVLVSCFEARVVGVLVSHRTAVRCYQEGAASGSGVVVESS